MLRKVHISDSLSQLDLGDLKHLRLTCKALAEGLASLVLRHISVLAKKSASISELISHLQHLSQPNNAVVRYTRQITIGPMNVERIDDGNLEGTILNALISLKGVEAVMCVPSLTPNLVVSHLPLVGIPRTTILNGFKKLYGTPFWALDPISFICLSMWRI